MKGENDRMKHDLFGQDLPQQGTGFVPLSLQRLHILPTDPLAVLCFL